MNTKIKNIIKAVVLGLGLIATGSVQAGEDLDAYLADMPELSYQSEVVDCEIAKKMAANGAWWFMLNPQANEADALAAVTMTVVMDDDVTNNLMNNFDSPVEKGAEELVDTYRGFFMYGMFSEVADYAKEPQDYSKMGVKEKRGRAKLIGINAQTACEYAKKQKGQKMLRELVGTYRLQMGKW